jgi:hypothetical protein
MQIRHCSWRVLHGVLFRSGAKKRIRTKCFRFCPAFCGHSADK